MNKKSRIPLRCEVQRKAFTAQAILFRNKNCAVLSALKRVAIKVVFKRAEEEDEREEDTEINILRTLQGHPNIIPLLAFHRGNARDVLVMPLMRDTLRSMMECPLRRARCNTLTRQLVSAVAHCHRNDVMHRDIKPENILVDWRGNLCLCDFGISTFISYDPPHYMTANTLWYRPPEVSLDAGFNYDEKVDIWALGCVIHEMEGNAVLFAHHTQKGVLRRQLAVLGEPTRRLPRWCYIPTVAKRAVAMTPTVRRCLQWDPKDRPGADDVSTVDE